MQLARLTHQQIADYQRNGFVIPDYRVSEATLEKMRIAYKKLLADNPSIRADLILGPHLAVPGSQGVKGSPDWLDFATQRDIIDMVTQLIGNDVILWGTTLFGKPARNGKETPWHQDGDYYPIRPLETLSIWIALDDATVENGCMRFVPGSHKKRQLFGHHREENPDLTINVVCDREHFDESTTFNLELKAGQLSFHDVYMIHGSHANKTDRRRAAFVVRLMPGHCYYDHALGEEMGMAHRAHDYGRRPLFLIRGKDGSGKNDFAIGHC